MLSTRIYRFHRLIRAANDQPTKWLIANVRNYRPERDVSKLSLLACLRIICARTNSSGLPYRERMRQTRQQFGLLSLSPARQTPHYPN